MHVVNEDTKCGPCAAMPTYLKKLCWKPMVSATLELPDGNQIDRRHQSPTEIRRTLRIAWANLCLSANPTPKKLLPSSRLMSTCNIRSI